MTKELDIIQNVSRGLADIVRKVKQQEIEPQSKVYDNEPEPYDHWDHCVEDPGECHGGHYSEPYEPFWTGNDD